MAEQIGEAELFISRIKAREARDKGSLFSLLGPGPSTSQPTTAVAPDDEDDYDDLGNLQGLGAPKQDDDIVDSILRRKPTIDDKLLENLLGKKAADAKRKSQAQAAAASKSNIASNHAAPKSVSASRPARPGASRPGGPRQDESDDDDDLGRAAALSSRRKTRDTKRPAYTGNGAEAAGLIDPDAEPPDPRQDVATVVEMVNGLKTLAQVSRENDEEERPREKKATSYLDEMLNKKKKKKKKGKKT